MKRPVASDNMSMAMSRTPYRVSFFGGGTEIAALTDGALHQVKVAALDVAGFPGEAVMRWAERGHIAG